MVTALTALKKQIQIGNESTPGTAVPATAAMLGIMEAVLTSQVFTYPEDDRNLLAIHKGNEFKTSDTAELTMTSDLNSRDAVFLFGSTIAGNITPTQPDVTNEPLAYLWTYQGGLTTSNTPEITNGIDTYTIEYGDNVDDYEARYCFTKTLVISGSADGAVTFDWTITCADITAGITATAALAVPTPQYFPFPKAQFYIDTSYAGIGGTVKTDLLKGFTWTLETQFTPRFTAGGVYIMTGVNEAAKSVKLELEYLRSSAQSETEKALSIAGSTTYIRIALMGATEIDSAQSNPPYIYLDGAYHYMDWPAPEDADGMRSETVTAESVYDATGTRDFEVSVKTDLAAWPS